MMKTEQVQLIQIEKKNTNKSDSKGLVRATLKGTGIRHRTTKRQKRKMREQEVESHSEHNGKQQVFNKFSSYLNSQKKKILKEKLIQYYGKNFPIDYQQKYNFDQQWNNSISAYDKIKEMRPYFQASLQIGLSLLTMVVYTATVWINTVQNFIHFENSLILGNRQVSYIALVLQIINIIFKTVNQREVHRKDFSKQILSLIKIVKIQLLTLSYFIGKLIMGEEKPIIWILFEWTVWIVIYRQASKIYQQLRLTSFCLHHEYQTKLMDMLVTIFVIAHFIAIIMYAATRYDPQHNWLTPLDIDKADALTVYNYAFYFTVTTIMTVGYGDIIPKNRAQIIVVSFVQIFGIIMFAYMMNQIGYCISSLRKSKQAMDRDLFMVQKLRHHYKMGDQLTAKVRGYLLDAKPKLDQVLPQEQQGILMKLNEEIREDMSRQNMAAIVRSSIFFICRWSRSLQQSVSRSLTHIIAKPNDILYQPLGKQRVYIIKSGQVHIYAQKVGYKRGMRHPLKSIQSSLKGDISDNCYGYSAAISTRYTKIYAISKVFSSCYYIDKAAFFECVKEKSADFQYYHQIKNRIDQAKICETFQVPRLQSSKHHYIPSFSFLLYKYFKQDKTKNERMLVKRSDRVLNWKKIYDNKQVQWICQRYTDQIQFFQNTDKISLPRQSKDMINILTLLKITNETIDPKKDFEHHFQASKSYVNYFKNHNIEDVLKKYDNSYLPAKIQSPSKINFSLNINQQPGKKDKNQTFDC